MKAFEKRNADPPEHHDRGADGPHQVGRHEGQEDDRGGHDESGTTEACSPVGPGNEVTPTEELFIALPVLVDTETLVAGLWLILLTRLHVDVVVLIVESLNLSQALSKGSQA